MDFRERSVASGWYLLYTVHTGVYAHVSYMGTWPLPHARLKSLDNVAPLFARGVVIRAMQVRETVTRQALFAPCLNCVALTPQFPSSNFPCIPLRMPRVLDSGPL
jgi:hypothetical protein